MPPTSLMRRSYGQLPAHTYTGWNNLGDVHATLRELEFGRFRNAAIMWDQMKRDDRFSAVLDTRIDALGSRPMMVKPSDETDQAKAIAEDLGGLDDVPGRWRDQFPPEDLGELLEWGIGLNLGVAEIIWDPATPVSKLLVQGGVFAEGDTRWTPRLKIWHPQFVRWDWGTQRFKIMTVDGEVDLPQLDTNPRGDGKWLLYCPRGYHQAWMKGAIRSMAVTVLERGLNRKYWGRFNEKYGLPIDVLKAPASAPGDMKAAVADQIANRGGETFLMLESTKSVDGDAAALGEEWTFTIEEVKGGAAYKTFSDRQNALNVDMAVKTLGQNLTTEVGDAGSKAAEAGHNDIRIEKLKKDAGIADAVHDQVLVPDAMLNYGDESLAPRVFFQADPEEDLTERATMLSNLATALSGFQTAGTPIEVRKTLEKFEIDVMTPEEEAAMKAQKAEDDANALVMVQQKRAALSGPAGDQAEEDDAPAAAGDSKKMQGGPLPGTSGVAKYVKFGGMVLAIENPAGTHRVWTDSDGKTGSTKMSSDYGFVVGHNLSGDREQLDCYLGPDVDSKWVHVVHQKLAPDFKRWDEDKVVFAAASADAAKAIYLAHRSDGEQAYGGMSTIPLDVFEKKLKRRRGAGKIRAGASPEQLADTTRALVALAMRAGGAVTAAARQPTPKRLATADRLQAAATAAATTALAPYLAKVKATIQGSSSPAEAEQRLLSVFKHEDPARLTEVIKRFRILANLAGDASVMKQIGGKKK